MKRVLIIKMSSMGDVIHTLPALTDAQRVFPDIQFDWVVEPGFAEIPHWHPAVKNVLPISLRRWRKEPWQCFRQGEWQAFIRKLRYTTYDAVIDAQGLVKSALVARFSKGTTYGLGYKSTRGKFVSIAYQHAFDVAQNQHAVEKTRELFAQVFNYQHPKKAPDYGIDKKKLADISYGDNTVIFLHGTTWVTKHWPQHYWQALAYLVSQQGFHVLLPWGNDKELQRAQSIKMYCQERGIVNAPEVLPKLSLGEITSLLAKAKGVVGVDTGFSHIAAAMAVPTISLYGPTDPLLIGAYGPNQQHLKVSTSCAPCFGRECKLGTNFATLPPCFETLPPEKVYQVLMQAMVKPSSPNSIFKFAENEQNGSDT